TRSTGTGSIRSPPSPTRMTSPEPTRSPKPPGPMTASARTPPQIGSNRCAGESKGSGSGRSSIGRSVAGGCGTAASSRSDSWSGIGAILAARLDRVARRAPIPARSAATHQGTTVTASPRRAPRPDDLYRIVVPTDPRLSPDGSRVTFTVQRVRPTFEGYASAIWTVATDGSDEPRALTIGARHDGHARWSPDG